MGPGQSARKKHARDDDAETPHKRKSLSGAPTPTTTTATTATTTTTTAAAAGDDKVDTLWSKLTKKQSAAKDAKPVAGAAPATGAAAAAAKVKKDERALPAFKEQTRVIKKVGPVSTVTGKRTADALTPTAAKRAKEEADDPFAPRR